MIRLIDKKNAPVCSGPSFVFSFFLFCNKAVYLVYIWNNVCFVVSTFVMKVYMGKE